MSDEKENEGNLNNLASQHEGWLRSNNVVTTLTHNTIVLNLYVQFPIKYVEYSMNPDDETLDLTVYLGFWRALFTNKKKMMDRMFEMFSEYLPNYQITLRVALYRSNIERKLQNEKPKSKSRNSSDPDDLADFEKNVRRNATLNKADIISKLRAATGDGNSGGDPIPPAFLSERADESGDDSGSHS
jgi:hypothetical protein